MTGNDSFMIKDNLRIIIGFLFVAWIVYILVLAKMSNNKYRKLIVTDNVSRKLFSIEKGKIKKQHLIKIFAGLFIFLIIILFLIFLTQFD